MDIKPNPDWMTFRDIKEYLGYKSHQGVHALVFVSRAFDERDVTYVTTAQQPLYLVRRTAVEAYARLRKKVAEQAQQGKAAGETLHAFHIATVAARRRMRALFKERGINGRQARINYVSTVLDQPVDDWYGLTLDDATAVARRLAGEFDAKIAV